MVAEVIVRGRVSRVLPQPDLDGGRDGEPLRIGRYDEQYVLMPVTKKHILADEGSYMVTALAPGATVLQLGISASFSPTAAALIFQNTDTPGKANAKRCYLDYIKMIVSTVPTSATLWYYASVIDSKDRTPSTTVAKGGTPATATCYPETSVCTNMDETPQIVGKIFYPLSTSGGAPPTVPAAGSATRTFIGQGSLRAQIPVALDEYWIDFGGDIPSGQLVTAAAAGASRVVAPHPPVVIGPSQFYLLYLWGTSNVTAGMAFSGLDVGWWER